MIVAERLLMNVPARMDSRVVLGEELDKSLNILSTENWYSK